MSIKRISVLILCHVLKPFVKSTPETRNVSKCPGFFYHVLDIEI